MSFITYVEVLYEFKFHYSTVRKLMLSVFVSILYSYIKFYEAFLNTEYCTKEVGSWHGRAMWNLLFREIPGYYVK
jgi:hypothetical protein